MGTAADTQKAVMPREGRVARSSRAMTALGAGHDEPYAASVL
jgi:hypothetical protein